jgi:hypothetical protein
MTDAMRTNVEYVVSVLEKRPPEQLSNYEKSILRRGRMLLCELQIIRIVPEIKRISQ